jgi:hypothetical protein
VSEPEHGKLKHVDGKYKKSVLPLTRCVGTKYPYFNNFSLIMVITRVYPRLAKFIKEKKLQAGPGIMELYYTEAPKSCIQVMTPL